MNAGLRTFPKTWLTNYAGGAISRREMCHPPFKILSSGTKLMIDGNYRSDWSEKIRISQAAYYLCGLRKVEFAPSEPRN